MLVPIIDPYIHFIDLEFIGKTKKFEVRSNQADFLLGEIKFNKAWNSYAFYPEEKMYFTSEVLNAIKEFIDGLAKQYLESKKQ